MSSSAPVFGKRNAPRRVARHLVTPVPAAPTSAVEGQTAFFAVVRTEMEETVDNRPVVVPLSFKAASLAGLVVGCGLVGFYLTGSEGANQFTGVTAALGLKVEIGGSLMPAMILLGLFGGARTAALNLVIVHGLLRRAKLTSRVAYAVGGVVAAACLTTVLFAALGRAPAHGWPVELVAGAAGGFFYRVFAGSRPAQADGAPA